MQVYDPTTVPAAVQDVTLQDLMDAVKDEADMTGSSFLSDVQLVRWINVELAELYDLLIGSYSDYFVAQITGLAVTAGVATLPGNFFKAQAIYLYSGSDYLRVKRMNMREYDRFVNTTVSTGANLGGSYRYRELGGSLLFSPTPPATHTVRMFYVPQLPKLVMAADKVNLNVPVGWEDFVVAGAAARALAKEESDNSYQLQRKMYIKQHIIEMAGRDESSEDAVVDVYRRFGSDYGDMDVDE